MANDIPGGGGSNLSNLQRTGVWTNEWMGEGNTGTASVDTSKMGFVDPAKLPQGTGTAGNWLNDIVEASKSTGIQITSSTLGGSVPYPPTTENGTHPMGSLTVKDGKIQTAGGYTIEQLGQFEWKITGRDGKHTRIWGDPHVDEGDGGKWDFKKNSTFVLGDGTQIHVNTKPWGKNGEMTVTGGLEVVSGNDRVMVTDIDKGKGKVGEVTRDGYSRAGHLEDDVFVMGNDTDDWALGKGSKEIVGSEKGGEVFKTGNDLMMGFADWNASENRFFKGFHGRADPLDSQQFLDYYSKWTNGGNKGVGYTGTNGKAGEKITNVDAGSVTNHDGKPQGASNANPLQAALAMFANLQTLLGGNENNNAAKVAEGFRHLSSMLSIISEMATLRDQMMRQRPL